MSAMTFTPVTVFDLDEPCVVTSYAFEREPIRHPGRAVKIVRTYGSDGSSRRNVFVTPRSWKRDAFALTYADDVVVEQDGRVLFDTREQN